MSTAAKKAVFESAFIPHVGWLRHDSGDEVISLLRQGYFEGAEQAFFWLFLRTGDTFIDGGAHIGLYSLVAHRVMDGKGRIIAVEPDEGTAAHLRANLKRNGAVEARIIRAALWKSAGSIGFVHESEGRAAYAHVSFESAEPHVRVPAFTLDKVVSESGADQVALVKIDVEGAEPEALEGAREAIAKGAAPLLMIEVAEHNLRRRGLATQDLVAQIEAMGYALFEFVPETLQLKPCSVEGPIWFKNLFACSDPKRVNARLRAATSDRKEIARDILGRAAACARFKELEELERFRHLADISEGNRQWAERAEQLLSSEREIVEEMRSRIDAAELLAAENKAWGERSDENLAEQRAISADLESRLAAIAKAAEDNRRWAERTEEKLALQKRAAEDNRLWAEQTEGFLTEQKAIARDLADRLAAKERAAEDHRASAEQTGVFLAAQKVISDGLADQLSATERASANNRAWAERTEELLAAQRAIAEDLANRISDKERLAEDNRAWAERTEAKLAAATKVGEELRAQLTQARAEIDRLQEEIPPLRVFATRFAWIYRLSRKFGEKS